MEYQMLETSHTLVVALTPDEWRLIDEALLAMMSDDDDEYRALWTRFAGGGASGV